MFALLALALLLPSPAVAWWDYGHETVARIAWLEASPRTRAQVSRLLRHQDLLGTPECRARTIGQAAIWADCVKKLGDRFRYASPWHYQNIQICGTFDLVAACPDGGCLTVQIARHWARLADRGAPVRERLLALAFLTHLIGDLHQPLQIGDRGDRGGNDLRIAYGLIGGRTNLDQILDGYVAERAISASPAGPRGLLSGLDPVARRAERAGSVADWARQSWELSRAHAYGIAFDDPCAPNAVPRPIVTEADTRRLIPVLRLQIARAGVRLARLLDEALG
jgi:hypothetical protein